MDVCEEKRKDITTPGSTNYSTQLIESESSLEIEKRRNQAIHDNGDDYQTTTHVNMAATVLLSSGPMIRSKPNAHSSSAVRYRECLKNHAASVGRNILDGCGEFIPSGEKGTIEALKCAACECHRNFHRKEIDRETKLLISSSSNHLMQLPFPALPSPSTSLHQKFSLGLNLHSSPRSAPIIAPVNVAFRTATGRTESSNMDLPESPPFLASSKKRFRTKFTAEQKEKMTEFAEKVGWRIQKQNEDEIAGFCAQVGVKKQVLRVWMHNNKSTINKKIYEPNYETQEQNLEMARTGDQEASFN